MPSATQAEALRQWVLAALSVDDEGEVPDPMPIEDEAILWTDQDHPTLSRFVLLQGLAFSGEPVRLRYADGQEVREREREWTVLVTVVTKPSRSSTAAEQMADQASRYLERLTSATVGDWTRGMADVGLAVLRVGDVTDDARLRGSTEWESRATLTLVMRSAWRAVRTVEVVERVLGEGEVDQVAALAFDSDRGA